MYSWEKISPIREPMDHDEPGEPTALQPKDPSQDEQSWPRIGDALVYRLDKGKSVVMKRILKGFGASQEVVHFTLTMPDVSMTEDEGCMFEVTPPEGLATGDSFTVQLQNKKMILRPPTGYKSGDRLLLIVPKLEDHQFPKQLIPSRASASADEECINKTFYVKTPYDARAGNMILVRPPWTMGDVSTNVPESRIVLFVPEGAVPGTTVLECGTEEIQIQDMRAVAQVQGPMKARQVIYNGQSCYAIQLSDRPISSSTLFVQIQSENVGVPTSAILHLPQGHTPSGSIICCPTWIHPPSTFEGGVSRELNNGDAESAPKPVNTDYIADEDYDEVNGENSNVHHFEVPANSSAGETIIGVTSDGLSFSFCVPEGLGPSRQVAVRLPRHDSRILHGYARI